MGFLSVQHPTVSQVPYVAVIADSSLTWVGRGTWGWQPEQHSARVPIQLLSLDRNPNVNCLFIFEGTIPKDTSRILPMLVELQALNYY